MQQLRAIWDICMLRKGPQDLPYSLQLLLLMIGLGILVDSYLNSIFFPKLATIEIIITVTVSTLTLLLAIYLLLWLRNLTNRGIQTLTALAGSGLFISLVLLPTIELINHFPQAGKPFGIITLIYYAWILSVNTHIFRHAFSLGTLMSMIFAVSYFLLGFFVTEILLFPKGG